MANITRFLLDTASKIDEKTGVNRLLNSTLGLFQSERLGRAKTTPGDVDTPFTVNMNDKQDFRVKLILPKTHTLGDQFGPFPIKNIIFPYTPTISQDFSASYTTVNPTHSNYSFNFYKGSTPGPISISGKFTVQNDSEARNWLATVHLLRSLMKMRFGQDSNAGAPPPICRFNAYGNHQYSNVPVVIQSFKMELPSDVDYYSTKGLPNDSPRSPGQIEYAEYNMVPTVSTISIVLLPTYSRRELLAQAQVTNYLNGSAKPQGYL